MVESTKLPLRFFFPAALESARPREFHARFDARRHRPAQRSGMPGTQLCLLAWIELPDRHRNEVCRQIRLRCEAFIGSVRVDRSQRRPEIDKLVSEVVARLLGATSLPKDKTSMKSELPDVPDSVPSGSAGRHVNPSAHPPWLTSGQLDEFDSVRDARVSWVVEQTCNRQALFQRYEEVRRRERGGKWNGSHYPLLIVDEQAIEQLSGHYEFAEDETSVLHAEDARRAWNGLLQLAERHFRSSDDVVALVRLLVHDRDTQEAFDGRWPIGKIARALNAALQNGLWNDARVENAKRRLMKFIFRFKQENGLDAIDLRALLVRYGRQQVTRPSAGPQTK